MNPPGLGLSLTDFGLKSQSLQPAQPKQGMLPLIHPWLQLQRSRALGKHFPVQIPEFGDVTRANLGGCRDWSRALQQSSLSARVSINAHQLPGGRGRSRIPAKTRDKGTELGHHGVASAEPRCPLSSHIRGHRGEIPAAAKAQPHLSLDLFFPQDIPTGHIFQLIFNFFFCLPKD